MWFGGIVVRSASVLLLITHHLAKHYNALSECPQGEIIKSLKLGEMPQLDEHRRLKMHIRFACAIMIARNLLAYYHKEFVCAPVAQSAEHRTFNPGVAGSIPARRT
jgi:hypothetical protein